MSIGLHLNDFLTSVHAAEGLTLQLKYSTKENTFDDQSFVLWLYTKLLNVYIYTKWLTKLHQFFLFEDMIMSVNTFTLPTGLIAILKIEISFNTGIVYV